MTIRVRAILLYLRTLGLGLRVILAGGFKEGARILIAPTGYWRVFPNAYVDREFSKYKDPRVLDVGSPKVLSLLLAGRTANRLFATDLEDRKIFSRYGKTAQLLGYGNYVPELQDARAQPYPDESFDLIYSISVIEHIPEDGDTRALEECRRLLHPGGTLVVEVPYRREARTIMASYDSRGDSAEDPMFYERHYDAASLEERLQVDGLELSERLILGETLPFDPWIAVPRLPRWVRFLLLPLEPPVAFLNYWSRPDDRTGRPLCALLIFRKASQ
jgi:SAM-dependent methyltransferase